MSQRDADLSPACYELQCSFRSWLGAELYNAYAEANPAKLRTELVNYLTKLRKRHEVSNNAARLEDWKSKRALLCLTPSWDCYAGMNEPLRGILDGKIVATKPQIVRKALMQYLTKILDYVRQ